MSKSLNQAFIKAYSKEQASLAKQQGPEKSSQSKGEDFRIEDFIVRFDTATCVIPAHQPAQNQLPKITVGSLTGLPLPTVAPIHSRSAPASADTSNQSIQPSTMPRPAATAAAMSTSGATVLNLSRRGRGESAPLRTGATHREQELAAERRAAEELRNTIASQMSRAGTWEAQQIDPFDGGFPMVSPYYHRRGQTGGEQNRNQAHQSPVAGSEPEPRTERGQASQSSNGNQPSQLGGPHLGFVESRAPVAAAQPRSQAATHQAAQLRPPQAAPARQSNQHRVVVGNELDEQKQPAPAINSSPLAASQRSDGNNYPGERYQPAEREPRLSPLQSPALPPQMVREQQAALAAQLTRQARVHDCGGQGEIFRLDRPSYQHRPEGNELGDVGDSGELSSEVLGWSASATNVDIETMVSPEDLQRPPVDGRRRVDAADRGRESVQEPAVQRLQRGETVAASRNASHTAAASRSIEEQSASAAESSAASTASTRASRDWPAKSLEQDLRQAKVRIFNPVWEVDSFQWPEICVELLQQRAAAMELVARNLIEACQEGLQVLAVTSPHSGEGRTTVACCLAKLAGSRGLNVAIVDGDIENPTLSVQTNLELEQDWKTAIFNQLPLEEVAVHSIEDQVTLVPLVQPIDRDEMAIDDNRIEFMLQELSASFDLVIVDMGHMQSSRSLVTSLGERGVISAVVAVVDYRSSTRQQVDSCLQRIRQTGVSSIGLVENFAA